MKIGLDLDGVVFDSETTFRTYEELFDISKNQNKLVDRSEPKYQKRYSWNEAEIKEFENCYYEVSKTSPLMPGFKKVYELLKKDGVELISISARGLSGNGTEMQFMEDDAKRILKENNIVLNKSYWKQADKLTACKKEIIDLMIEDDYHIITTLANAKIKTLYFRHANLKKLAENEFITEVNNWGDVYRVVHNLLKTNS